MAALDSQEKSDLNCICLGSRLHLPEIDSSREGCANMTASRCERSMDRLPRQLIEPPRRRHSPGGAQLPHAPSFVPPCTVIPAKAGIQSFAAIDSRLRGNDVCSAGGVGGTHQG